ncbi:hypothetical protein M426DRAFT_325106 [Hypoxylon sp. CI-4A]|nr:hypothetical protein M426DRAFT_325106 [Hypoxylon sp. CI-4A]
MGKPAEADGAIESGAAPPPYSATDIGARETPHASEAPTYEAVPGSSRNTSTRVIAGVKHRFPQSLNAYYQKLGFSKSLNLGEHADKPLFAVSMHSGLSGKPMLELHAGPSTSDPIIATSGNRSVFSSGMTTVVQIMPAASLFSQDSASGSTSQAQAAAAAAAAVETITMKETHDWRHLNITYPFSLEVGLGGGSSKDTRVEHFEWRSSRGAEIQTLTQFSRGYKLVRVGSSAVGQGGRRATRAAGATSDGLEVVAVCAYNGSWSLSKAFKFQFLESGATGVLGDRFALVALMSGLKIWYVEMIAATAGAAA